jgi:hypothetical protein
MSKLNSLIKNNLDILIYEDVSIYKPIFVKQNKTYKEIFIGFSITLRNL